jgi:hypothetical protein
VSWKKIFINSIKAMLPPGVFPKTLLFVGFAAIYNTVQCFVPAWRLTPRIYARKKEEGRNSLFSINIM